MRGLTALSVLMWLVAVLFVFSAALVSLVRRPSPPDLSHYQLALTQLYLGAATGVLAWGAGKRRRWAWDGTVVLCGSSLLFCFVLFSQSLGVPKSHNLVVGLLVLALIGTMPTLLCLWYLCRSNTRQAFSVGRYGTTEQPSLWTGLIASQSIFGSGLVLSEALDRTPALFFGITNTGVQVLLALVLTYLGAYVGWGLYKKRDVARRYAIGLSAFGIVRISYWALKKPMRRPEFLYVRVGGVAVAILISCAVIYYLITRRGEFIRAGADEPLVQA